MERKNITRNKRRVSNSERAYYGGAGHGSKIEVTLKTLEESKKQLKLL